MRRFIFPWRMRWTVSSSSVPGECGTRAAFALREAGYSGSITLIGAEPHLPYERPAAVETHEWCGADEIDMREGSARGGRHRLSRCVGLEAGCRRRNPDLKRRRVSRYEKLLFRHGRTSETVACPGAELALDFRTHADAEAIFANVAPGRSVAIIGGGLIGMELASGTARKRGRGLAVIEAAPKPLGRAVPPRFAEKLHARHAAEGVRFYLGRGWWQSATMELL